MLNKERYSFNDLVDIVTMLRGEGGCPWDREQDHKSIRDDLIEETYEVIEAIDTEDPKLLREELGDVLLQIVFHASISSDEKNFNIDDVTDEICRKMIYRHPHVFGDVSADTSEEVLRNWEKLKSEEKQRMTVTDKLNAIPRQLPALMRATKVGKKASCFDFPDKESVIQKLHEEISELERAINNEDQDNMHEEVGDLLLTITSLCRKIDVNAERALNDATDKFISRFDKVEKRVIEQNKDIKKMNIVELDSIWDQIKHNN
ncbi:MAG: nucleoside triphosphate pyrophosphohydrolase [Clostridia bacterium]|nr:nucleoside triphosphate pyrophosphohydrolase [Clostridia bacterium]